MTFSSSGHAVADIVPRYIIDKEYEKLKISNIVLEVEDGNCTLNQCEKACRALSTISAIALQTSNAELLLEFLDGGVCELLVLILNKYGIENVSICNYVCRTVCNMCYCSRELREFLGEVGICEMIIFVMSLHIGDPDVSEHGTCAICLLARNNHVNSIRLVDAQVFECLSQVGNFGFNIKNERSSLVASYVCLAFSILCEAANSIALLESGADQLVLEFLKCHKDNESFIPAGMKALCSLASLNYDHREVLGKNSACHIIFSIIKAEDRANVIQDGVEAVMHLAVNPGNSRRLKDAEACIWITKFLHEKLVYQPYGAEVCTGAILNMISKGPAMNDHFLQLQQCNAVNILQHAESNPKTSFKARENIFHIMETIEYHNSLHEKTPSKPSYRMSEERDDDHYQRRSSSPNTNSNSSNSITPKRHSTSSIAVLPSAEVVESLPKNVREYVEFRRKTLTSDTLSDHEEDINLNMTIPVPVAMNDSMKKQMSITENRSLSVGH